jgi:SAM-dependent methyltransferase|tara:strand:- start:118 stop:873 length:756 start_codon:yes stop_codon:yes gene_type:complete
MFKKIVLKIAEIISILWKIIPFRIRLGIFTSLLIVESRGFNIKFGLSRLFLIKDKMNWIINERALALGHGIHPKHRLTNYHSFFINNIKDGQKVLDIGCGYGAVANSIALSRPKSKVCGIDIDEKKLNMAKRKSNLNNLNFLKYDATENLPKDNWEIIVLSNVLEHIDNRVSFLKKIIKNSGSKTFLIRVPHFDRSWEIPQRKELGINYYSDDDHKIEHTLEEFIKEIKDAGLTPKEVRTIWGEIWCKSSI